MSRLAASTRLAAASCGHCSLRLLALLHVRHAPRTC